MDQALSEDIKRQVLPLLAKEGVELVELFINRGRGRSTLRFLVTKPGGITLDECAQLNREIGRILEQKNLIQEAYILEVSSPGLDRPMKNTRDFQRCLGEPVRIVLHESLNRENVWKGFLKEVDQANVIIQTENEQRLCISRKNIARANAEVQL